MGDTHVAYSTAMSDEEQKGWTAKRSDKAINLMGAMAKHYIELVKRRTQ